MYRIQFRTAPNFLQKCLTMPSRTLGSSKDVPVSKRRYYGDDEDRYWPARVLNQQMRNMERMFDEFVPYRVQRWWNRPSWIFDYPMTRAEQDVKVDYNDKRFEIKLNVANYNPEDLNVKISGNYLIICGKHSEKLDNYGHICREFTRRILVPEDVDLDSIESSYDDEELVLHGRVKGNEGSLERPVDIKQQLSKEQTEK